MSSRKVWNYWASRYESLWVQKYSLKPTRECVIKQLEPVERVNKVTELLDIGCGVGELIYDIGQAFGDENINITGLDYSEEMVKAAGIKNPKSTFINDDVYAVESIESKYSVITCTHSLPYYKDQQRAVEGFHGALEENGHLIIAFASQNSWYDKLCMFFVKFTTGFAKYPSIEKFKSMTEEIFSVEDIVVIRERKYMPTIAVFKLRKK